MSEETFEQKMKDIDAAKKKQSDARYFELLTEEARRTMRELPTVEENMRRLQVEELEKRTRHRLGLPSKAKQE